MTYKAGDRIELVRMSDPCPIEPGARGTVLDTTDAPANFPYEPKLLQELIMKWDDGRSLSVLLPLDEVKLIEKKD